MPVKPCILLVDDDLGSSATARGRRLAAIVSELASRGALVVPAQSYDDGRANVVSNAGLHAVLIDWTLGGADGATAVDLLRVIRERNDRVPIFLIANRAMASSLSAETARMADEFIWLLEDTAPFIAGRVLAAADRYLDGLLPPFAKALFSYDREREYSWAAPGHQGGVAFTKSPVGRLFFDFYGEALFRTDLGIERSSLGSLLDHTGPIAESERYAARVFGAHRSYAGLNGSSGANRAVLSACLGDGEIALIDRNCHKSISQGIAVTGAIPVYLRPTRNRFGIIGPIASDGLVPAAIDAAIAAHPLASSAASSRPGYAVITNCTYDGMCIDAEAAQARLGERADRIHFDEAWYAYARFHPLYAGRHAMHGDPAGHAADGPTVFATQSTHKLLAALSQAAFIHIRDGRRAIPHERFNEAYCLQATTSPLYPLLAANDVAAAMMDGPGGFALVHDAVREAVACRQAVARLHAELAGQGEWFFEPWNAREVSVPGHSQRIPFREAPAELLANSPECWVLEPGAPWHGFGNVAAGWCLLDPTKFGIVCPGMGDDGELAATGVPADLVTAYLTRRGIVPSRTTDHMVLFLFTIGVTKGKWGTLVHALLDFKRDFDANAPLEDVLPDLVAAAPVRYAGMGLADLAREMFAHLRESRQGFWQARACAELPRPVRTPRQAFQGLMAGRAELTPLSALAGRVSAVGVIPYPPGIPLVMPGEEFGPADGPWLSYLRALQAWAARFPGFGKEVEGATLRDGEYWIEVG